MKMELHLKFVKTGCGTFSFVVGKMFNDVPSYRVGKEIRADLKGSLSFPTSITRKGTRYTHLRSSKKLPILCIAPPPFRPPPFDDITGIRLREIVWDVYDSGLLPHKIRGNDKTGGKVVTPCQKPPDD